MGSSSCFLCLFFCLLLFVPLYTRGNHPPLYIACGGAQYTGLPPHTLPVLPPFLYISGSALTRLKACMATGLLP